MPASVFETLPPITAGAFSTATIMYPVDLVRALKMSSADAGAGTATLIKNFHAAHGMKGFVSQGVFPEMLRATYMRVSKFFLFPICHEAMFDSKPAQGTPLSKAAAAAVCTIPEGLSIAPIETAKIALQLDATNRYGNSMSNFVRTTIAQKGWTGLFVGYFGIAYRQTSWTAAYFASLSSFQEASSVVVPDTYPKVKQLAGGFAAGMFGAVFNTPGDVIRSTIQKRAIADAAGGKVPFSLGMMAGGVKSFVAEGAMIVSTKGPLALWTGFPFKAMHLGGSGALLAMFIPLFKRVMGVQQ